MRGSHVRLWAPDTGGEDTDCKRNPGALDKQCGYLAENAGMQFAGKNTEIFYVMGNLDEAGGLPASTMPNRLRSSDRFHMSLSPLAQKSNSQMRIY